MAHGFLNGSRYDEVNSSVVELIERTVADAKIPSGLKSIGAYAFESCKNLKSVSIPSSVTSIKNHAFHDCSALETIDIPDSVTEINSSAFHGCTGLKSIKLPQYIKVLDANLLYQCSSLTYIKIPPKIEEVNKSSLQCVNCLVFDFSGVEQVPYLKSVGAFSGTLVESKILVPAHLYDSWIVATNWANYSDRIVPVYDAPEVVVPDQVSEGLDIQRDYDGYRVMGRGSCTDSVVVIPEEYKDEPIVALGSGAFEGDETLEELYIKGSVHFFIDNCACDYSGLKKLYMENVEYIASISCRCDELEYVKFSSNISEIGQGAFRSSKAKTIYDFTAFKGENIPTLEFEYGTEGSTLSPDKILVPANRYQEWISATNWSYYAEYIVAAR